MLSVIGALMLSAAPVVVVAPFEVKSAEAVDADLGLALQNVMELDLAAVAIQTRTEDQLAESEWGKIKGASHLVAGTVSRMMGKLVVSTRLIALKDQQVLAVGKSTSPGVWHTRQPFVSKVLDALALPLPALQEKPELSEELLRAWGGALRAVHSGDPKVAKEKVADVVKRWPQFAPARARLEKL
jgi:hypothetical protein